MDKRQCLGLDKFHQCLSTLFPSKDESVCGDGSIEASDRDGGGNQPVGAETNKGGVGTSAQPHALGASPTTDRPRKIPVKFTKNAVELLRETLNGFLRRVGSDLMEELEEGDDPMSQQPIRPEDVVRVLLALDDDDDDAADEEEYDSNGKRRATSSKNGNLPTMKELVSQAQTLLLQRNELERQEAEEGSKKRRSTSNDSAGSRDCDSKDTLAANAKPPTTATAQAERPKPTKRKRKKQKIKITAEMEAEQERLLNASKQALEASGQQRGGNGKDASSSSSFRVELK